VVLQVRGGTVLGKERRRLRGTAGEADEAVMAAFLAQYYRERETPPAEIAAAVSPADAGLLAKWLSAKGGRRVEVRVPERGRLAGLARLAVENARLDLEEARGTDRRRPLVPSVYALQRALELPSPPAHIEGVDISNLQATHPVASVVVFRNGVPARAAYRRFRMRHPAPHDVAMIGEVVARRAARIHAGEFPAPDLLLIDGGPGQLGAAVTALDQEGLGDVPVVSLAKREEEIHVPGRAEPIRLPRSDPGLRLLMHVRDEAHRFALRFHRARRAKAGLFSRLDTIPGVGERRRLLLLHAFGSPDGVAAATAEELAAVPGIGVKVARHVFETLHAGKEISDAV
jgi:excinuclease ABC subunit C